jgi:hypothetical protein
MTLNNNSARDLPATLSLKETRAHLRLLQPQNPEPLTLNLEPMNL